MTLKIGDKLPAFKGETDKGTITDQDLRGSNVVLYFYPKDDTPGCTIEACAFRDNLPKFTRMNAKIFGISRDDLKSHAKFAGKFELPFTLISDSDGSICESFGTWVEKKNYGKTYMGIGRATYLADSDGVIRQIWRNVKAAGHAEEVLDAVKKLD
ncbi:MAG TPA: thioredoxin-dependent thiol peroxidase [Patescibacteria group bacterium]|nr:thioredoxin-dependent thiol peroxidase [Patescibacteria group bacterium]